MKLKKKKKKLYYLKNLRVQSKKHTWCNYSMWCPVIEEGARSTKGNPNMERFTQISLGRLKVALGLRRAERKGQCFVRTQEHT